MTLSKEDFDRLYDAPLDRFVEVRNELAVELKEAGENDRAGEVKKLRKPALTLWALNRIARARPDLVEVLIQAGTALREASETGDAAAIRAGTADRRRAVSDLLEAAGAELKADGHAAGRDTLERLSRSLLAATSDEETSARLAEGTLTAEPQASDVGWGSMAPESPDPDLTEAAEARRADLSEEAEKAQHKAAEMASEAQSLEREAVRQEKAAERARSRADGARRAAERAQRAADEAVARLKR